MTLSFEKEAQATLALKRLLIFFVVAIAGIVAACFTPLGDYFSKENMRRVASDLGWGGPAVIFVAGAVTPLLFLPRWPIAFVAGLLYGVVEGTIYSNIGSTVGGVIHFVLAQTLLAPSADRLRARYGLSQLAIPKDKAFIVLFLLRAFPISNFVATNLIAGALKIHFGAYLAATFFGMIPASIMYASWGKLVAQPSSSFGFLAIFTFVLIAGGAVAAQRYLYPMFRRLRRPGEAAGARGGGEAGGAAEAGRGGEAGSKAEARIETRAGPDSPPPAGEPRA